MEKYYTSRSSDRTKNGGKVHSSWGIMVVLKEFTPEEKMAFDAETARMLRQFDAYALSNPEVPVHE